MPHTRTSPTADRFFARLDKFECECPSCGRLLLAVMDQKSHTQARRALRQRTAVRITAKSRRDLTAVWNPHNQRLKCPWCSVVYMAGLLLWPASHTSRKILDPPPDVIPTAREVAAGRLKAGGWWASKAYERGQHVNVAVATPCSCPEKGWSVTCAVHGDLEAVRH